MAKKGHDIAKKDDVVRRLPDMTEAQVLRVVVDNDDEYREHEARGALAAYRVGAGLNEMKRRCKADGVSFNDWLDRNWSRTRDRRRAFRFMDLATQVEKVPGARAPLENTSVRAAFAAIGKVSAGGGTKRVESEKPSSPKVIDLVDAKVRDGAIDDTPAGRPPSSSPPVRPADQAHAGHEGTTHFVGDACPPAAPPAAPAPLLPAPAPVPIGALPPQADDPCEDCGSRYHATGDDVCPGAYADDEPPPAPADDYVDPDPRELAQHTLERHPLDPHAIFLLLYGSACPLPGFVSPHVLGRDVSHVQHVMALLREVWSQVDFKLEHKQFKNTEEHRLMAALRDRLGDCCTMAEEAVVRRHGQAADDQRRADVAAQKKRPAALEGARRG